MDQGTGRPFDTIIRCGVLIDGVSEEPLPHRDVAVRDGRVMSVTTAGSVPHNIESPVLIDLSELTCLPGLINTHVHFDGNPEDSVDYSIYARRTAMRTFNWCWITQKQPC